MLKESNRKYLEKYGLYSAKINDVVAEEIKGSRGKLYRYAKTHTEQECMEIIDTWWKNGVFSFYTRCVFQDYICTICKDRGNSIPSPRLAALAIMDDSSVYNTKNGLLVIPDVVEIDEQTKEELLERYNGYGVKSNNRLWLLGVMYCYIDPAKAQELLQKEGTLSDYALGAIPAPGTCAANRMDDYGIMCFSDLVHFFRELYKEEPEGWTYDGVMEEPHEDGHADPPRQSCKDEDETVSITASTGSMAIKK